MEKEFVSYEQAVALKELGFDEQCLAWHNSNRLFIDIDIYENYNSKTQYEYCCSIPLKQQVFRWFREKYELDSYIFSWSKREIGWGYDIRNDLSTVRQTNDNTFNTYEEAENACIDKLIEISKQLNKQ